MKTIITINTLLSSNAMDALKQTGDNFFADTTVILGVALLAAIVFSALGWLLAVRRASAAQRKISPILLWVQLWWREPLPLHLGCWAISHFSLVWKRRGEVASPSFSQKSSPNGLLLGRVE